MEKHDFDIDQHLTVIIPVADFSHDKRFSHLGQMWRCTAVRLIGAGQLELSLCNPNSDEEPCYEVTALSSVALSDGARGVADCRTGTIKLDKQPHWLPMHAHKAADLGCP